MTLDDFKQRVRAAFGPQMERATPANVREFLDEFARERWQEEKAKRAVASEFPGPPLELPPESATSYENILREFFSDTLNSTRDDTLIQLWVFALDMAYTGLEEQAAQQIGGLFDDCD